MRLAERTNAEASKYNWGIVLRWDGFHLESADTLANHDETPAIPRETAEAIEQNFRNVLRRFVSPDWIAGRLDDP